MALHLSKKQIISFAGVLFILLLLGCAFFWKDDILSAFSKEEPLKNEGIVIKQAPTTEEIIENALYKRIDFVNKLIADFKLNSHIGKDVYYKKNDTYKIVSLSTLLNLSMKELAEVRISMKENGIFLQKEDGTYISQEVYDKEQLEQAHQQL